MVLNNQWSFLRASPDGLISCQCCGQGVLEVTIVAYSCKDIPLHDYACKRESMLVPIQNTLSLKKDNQYYYQVECQHLVPSMLILLYGRYKTSHEDTSAR